jgi:hypothetical protein
MITNDPYGISHAVRPWDSADAKKPQKKESPCQRCNSREVCQKVGGTCNEKERWTG